MKLLHGIFFFICLVIMSNGHCAEPAEQQITHEFVRMASEAGDDSIDRMKKVADWQLTQSSWDSSVSWERGALHAGLMACYEATKDEAYLDSCRQWAEKFSWQLGWDNSNHADNIACAQTYMELYFLDESDDLRYEDFKNQSDAQVAIWPEYACNGTSGNYWWWCDALFMAPPALARLSRATGDPIYTEMMNMMWEDTQNCLYDNNQHLFYRDMSYLDDINCEGENQFWSRGNGWVLAGIARVLQYLPMDAPERPRYVLLLQEMAEKLKSIQQPDGYWHSDLLGPSCYDNPETSGTGFFTFGIAWGINNGYLDEASYWPTVQAGWEALNAAVQPNGLLGWVQPVGADPQTTSQYTTDVFGVGAYLLAGSEVEKYRLAHQPGTIDCFEGYNDDVALKMRWSDGEGNGSSLVVSLGDYGDNFMLLAYNNQQQPYYSETTCHFDFPKDFSSYDYLSILVRGDLSNLSDGLYLRLDDANAASVLQAIDDDSVVRTAKWMEIGIPLSRFAGLDLTKINKITIGVGDAVSPSPAANGIIRVDNVCLKKFDCVDGNQDFTGDCKTDLADLAVFAGDWLDDYRVIISPVDPGTENLLAYWPLDGDYNDFTGNYNAYEASGSDVSFVTPGHLGDSANFDGNSGLECADSEGLNLTDGLTISAWINSFGQSDSWACVIAKGFGSWRLIRNNYGTGNEIAFHFNSTDGENQANGRVNVLDGKWHHIMGIYDGQAIYLYVDGELDASAELGNKIPSISNDPVYIGSRVGRISDRSWNGQIDEVRIYNRALTMQERLWLSERPGYTILPSPTLQTDLVLDGIVDAEDLLELAANWMGDNIWP